MRPVLRTLPHRSHRTASRIVITLGLLALLCAGAQAATLTVGPAGPPTYGYATIQAAVTAATAGDTIQVAAGTYRENLVWSTKSLQLIGAGPGVCTINGDTDSNGTPNGVCLALTSVPAGARVEGFTITAGTTGISLSSSAALITGNTITANAGSGINCSGAGTNGTISNNTFSNNTAGSGGGIYCNAVSPTITGNTFSGNTANSGGGVACAYAAAPTISYNTFTGNTGNWYGGAIDCFNFCSPTITGNIIVGNTTPSMGGAMRLYRGAPSLTNNVIANCSANYGGGIYCDSAQPTLNLNTISGCSATTYGGGISASSCTLTITNTIIANCTSPTGAGIRNSGGTFSMSYSNVYPNSITGVTPAPIGINGNISLDPLFYDAANGDVHLKSTGGRWNGAGWSFDGVDSPCIDAGKPATAYANEPVPNGGRVNMGAYGNTVQASRTGDGQTPALSGVTITPDPAYTNTDLTGVPGTWFDPNGDAAGYDWQWEKNTDGGFAVIAGENTDTLASTSFVRGDVVRVTCWPNDGVHQGQPVTDQITISNTVPSITGVTISPNPAFSGDSLTATPAGWSDADGDPEGYDFRWDKWVGGVWQEIVVTPGPGLPAVNFVRDDLVRVTCWPNDGIVQGSPMTAQITIGNSPPSLSLVTISPDPAYATDDLLATPTGWADLDGDPEGYDWQWEKDTDDGFAVIPGEVTDTLASGNFVKGDQVRVTCTPNDGMSTGTPVTDTIVISNAPPSAPTVVIDPVAPNDADTLRATPSGSVDPDGDPIQYSYQWYKDGVLQPWGVWPGVSATRTALGEVWRCVVTPSDGSANGTPGEAQVTIAATNLPPSQPTVVIDPASPLDTNDLRANPSGSIDPNGHAVTYSYQWYKDGVLQPWAVWPGVAAWRTAAGQVWRCVVTPSDGFLNGTPGEAQVTILSSNQPPSQPTVVIAPASPVDTDNIRATPSGSVDPNGDTVTYKYQWFKDGVLQPACTWPSVSAWRTAAGQVWRCVVTPTDGLLNGTPGEAQVTITAPNQPPSQPTVVIAPASPVDTDNIRATASGSIDPNGDTVTYKYQWYRDGVLQPWGVWPGVQAYRTAAGETWRCVVTPTDGVADGPTGEASVVIAAKGPPVVVSSLAAIPVASGAEITFTLSANGSVSCEILNIAGRHVRTVVADRAVEAGVNSLAWNGASDAGVRAPAGIYLVRVSAASSDGSRSEIMSTISLTR